jgi:hypothetical protein
MGNARSCAVADGVWSCTRGWPIRKAAHCCKSCGAGELCRLKPGASSAARYSAYEAQPAVRLSAPPHSRHHPHHMGYRLGLGRYHTDKTHTKTTAKRLYTPAGGWVTAMTEGGWRPPCPVTPCRPVAPVLYSGCCSSLSAGEGVAPLPGGGVCMTHPGVLTPHTPEGKRPTPPPPHHHHHLSAIWD